MVTPVLVTTPGAGSVTVPANAYKAVLEAWAGGGCGGGGGSNYSGGSGGGYANTSCNVTPGSTLYWVVAAAKSGSTGDVAAGNNSWLNVSSNAQPSSISDGCYATGGAKGVGGAFGPTGASGYTGGYDPGTVGSGGGGAGSQGNGQNSQAFPGSGAGGTPDGGAGGAVPLSSGNGNPGTAPGGGGSEANKTSGIGGTGAAGQIRYTFYLANNSLTPQFLIFNFN